MYVYVCLVPFSQNQFSVSGGKCSFVAEKAVSVEYMNTFSVVSRLNDSDGRFEVSAQS